MSSLKAAYINEIFKISKKKKLIVASVLSIGALLLAGVIILSINNLAGIKMVGKGDFAVLILPFFEYTLIPLFTAFICIDMFSGEFTNETIKLTLTRPVSRLKVYLSKTLAAATFAFLFLMFTMICAVAVSFVFDSSSVNAVKAFAAYFTSFFPIFTTALMVMLVSNFARGSASAFLISIVIFILFKGMEFVIPAYKSFFFTSCFDWYKLFIGNYFNISKVIRILLIFAGYGIFFFSGGYYLFEKRSV